MRGLFLKDYCLLRQKHMLLIAGLLCIAGFFSIIPVLTLFFPIVLVMFAAGTITSDKAEYGWKALFVFPFSRRQYVLEKYVLILLASLPFTAIASFESIVLWKLDETLLAVNIAVLLLFTAFSVPTLLFFNPSAAQNFLAGYFMVFSVGGSVLLTSDLSIFFMQIPFVLGGSILCGSVVLLFLSVLLSMKIMARMEF